MFPIAKNNDLFTFRQCLRDNLLSFLGAPIFFWFEVNREKQLEYSQGPLLCDMGRFLNISESLLLYKG